jgi:hypothetical protein
MLSSSAIWQEYCKVSKQAGGATTVETMIQITATRLGITTTEVYVTLPIS